MNRPRTVWHDAIDAEIRLAALAESRGHFHSALSHLEHAHVLAQHVTVQHVRVHALMLALAWRNGLAGEVTGQLWRTAAAALFTLLDLPPRGNPGSTRVSGFRPVTIPTDMQRVIDAAR